MKKFSVRVRPRSRENKVERTERGIKVWLKSQARENQANKELIKVLSDYWQVSKSRVIIVSGEKSRDKVVAKLD